MLLSFLVNELHTYCMLIAVNVPYLSLLSRDLRCESDAIHNMMAKAQSDTARLSEFLTAQTKSDAMTSDKHRLTKHPTIRILYL